MTSKRIRLTDVSLTDGQTAVWAGAMTTPMVGAVVQRLADARPAAMEVCSPSTMRQCLARGEDPWQRLDLVRRRCAGMALRAALTLATDHGKRGADLIAPDLAAQWLGELVRRGVGEVLIIDPLLDLRRIIPVVKAAIALSMTPIAALPFYEDTDLDDETLCQQAAALAAAGASRVMLRDESGVMSPDRLAALLPALRQILGATPLDLHLGCQTALGPLIALDAIRLGIDGLDVAFAPLANGASVPSLGTLVKSAGLLGMDGSVEGIRMPAIDVANRLLASIADRHDLPVARPWAFSLLPHVHQLPGRVAAEFSERMESLNSGASLADFANECARIRGELGRPPMLAPFAQPIAEQAWLHLQGQPRYAEVRPGVRRIIQRVYGSTSHPVDPLLARRIGRIPKARPVSMKALRGRFPGVKDSALVLSQVCGLSPNALPAPVSKECLSYADTTPTEALIKGLTARAARFERLNVIGPDIALELCGDRGGHHA